jgi:hypothetical protein
MKRSPTLPPQLRKKGSHAIMRRARAYTCGQGGHGQSTRFRGRVLGRARPVEPQGRVEWSVHANLDDRSRMHHPVTLHQQCLICMYAQTPVERSESKNRAMASRAQEWEKILLYCYVRSPLNQLSSHETQVICAPFSRTQSISTHPLTGPNP